MPRLGAAALVLFSLAARAGAAWEYRTAHFRVVSEPGPEMAQAAAEHLEAARQRYGALGLPLPDEQEGPVLVLLFAERHSLDPYAPRGSRDPSRTRGLSLSGEDQRWIAVVWETAGNPLASLAHEYAHLVREQASDPPWFREGFAEYLAGLPGASPAATLGSNTAYHLRTLREEPWSGWQEMLATDRTSPVFAKASFYSQAWLAVYWLVSHGGDPAQLQPADFESLVSSRGPEWVDAQLREFAGGLWPKAAVRLPPSGTPADAAPPAPSPEVRSAEGWELPYWQAEFHRELNHGEQAQSTLEGLESDYPERPEPSESLGALAMARGQYDVAEEKLRAAIRKGSQKPSTHHRYSLMLLRPLEGPAGAETSDATAERAATAISHARLARKANPREPRYLLGEAQALLVAGLWDSAARLLAMLEAFPGWNEKADVEFAELLRRRQQALRSVAAPDVLGGAGAAHQAAWLDFSPPKVSKPNPTAQVAARFEWPPAGTVLLYGYISGVECREGEKIVRVKTPRFTVELREAAARPAKLYFPPLKWEKLPCGLRGYEVNVAYRPLPPGGAVRGELVAVVF